MINVSFIMGVYNSEESLSRCIKSIIEQTYKNWELIICDDNSTDKTYEIAKEFSDKYNNVILIKNQTNKGLAYSLNKCLEISKGKYIARIDADDLCLPNRLEAQVSFLEENQEYQVVGSSVILYDETGDKAIRYKKEIPDKYDLVIDVPFVHPTIMMRRETLKYLDGYTVSKRTRRGQDADLWYRFYSHGFKGYNLKTPLLKYHESIDDYKKRSFKVRWNGVKLRYRGFKTLKLPFWYYVFLFKPLIAGMIPKNLMYLYHKSISGKKNK